MGNLYSLIDKYSKEAVFIFCNNYKITYEELVEKFYEIEKLDLFVYNELYDSVKEILKVIKMFLDESGSTHDIKKEFNEAMKYYMGMIIKKRSNLENALNFCEEEFLI